MGARVQEKKKKTALSACGRQIFLTKEQIDLLHMEKMQPKRVQLGFRQQSRRAGLADLGL